MLWSFPANIHLVIRWPRLKLVLHPQFDNQDQQPYRLSFIVTFWYAFLPTGFSQYHINHQKFSNNIKHQKGKKKGVSNPFKTWLLMQIFSTSSSNLEALYTRGMGNFVTIPKPVSWFPHIRHMALSPPAPNSSLGRNLCWPLRRTLAVFSFQAYSWEDSEFFNIWDLNTPLFPTPTSCLA